MHTNSSNNRVDYSKAVEIAKLAAKKYARKFNADPDECLSAALFGLATSLKNWDPTRSALNTYVTMIAKCKILSALNGSKAASRREREHSGPAFNELLQNAPSRASTQCWEEEDRELVNLAIGLHSDGYKPSEIRSRLHKTLSAKGLRISQIEERFQAVLGGI